MRRILSASRLKGYVPKYWCARMGEKGICIGTGAACSRGKLSRVLLECGVSRALAEGTVRVSFSALNTLEEVAICLEELNNTVTQLRRFSRK